MGWSSVLFSRVWCGQEVPGVVSESGGLTGVRCTFPARRAKARISTTGRRQANRPSRGRTDRAPYRSPGGDRQAGGAPYPAARVHHRCARCRGSVALGTGDAGAGAWRSGAEATVTLVDARRDDAVAVPVAAIVDDGGSPAVRVAHADSPDRIIPVETGLVADGWVEITAGLDGGEEIRLPG
jgi:hypothetical protein